VAKSQVFFVSSSLCSRFLSGVWEIVQAEVEKLEEEVSKEKRREREAEIAAAAAVGYGLYEHHEETEAERGEKKHHGLFGLL
jgi:hypothetical protein